MAPRRIAVEIELQDGTWFAFFDNAQEDGTVVTLPLRREVCPRCDGRGVHDHEAFSNGISAEDFAEDSEFAEAYWEGAYNVPCSECNGRNVVDVVDVEAIPAWLRPAYDAWERDDDAWQNELAHERSMRARGIQF